MTADSRFTTQQTGRTAWDRARAYIAKIPGAVQGNGGDCQTLAVANVLIWDFDLSQSDALRILQEFNERCSPAWSETELIRKLQSAERQPHSKPRGSLLGERSSLNRRRPTSRKPLNKPNIDPATAVEAWLKGFRADEVDVWEASPVRPPDDWTKDALAVLENLYAPGEGINFVTACTVETQPDGTLKARPYGDGETVERSVLLNRWRTRGMPQSDAGGWLRMNPVSGGIRDSHVTAFRFALVECDHVPLDLQLSLLAKLPLPIAAILSSAGRSLHGWVKVDATGPEDYRETVARMLALLGRFGVDGKNSNPSRLSRLPGVVRHIGAEGDGRQRLIYLGSNPEQRPIL
jgi:hypothetical protein